MTIPKGTRLGPYEIEAQIGAGGMGAVYLAVDSRLERNVAIKILPSLFASDPQFLARFEREAKMISSLSHPNVCVLHDVGNAELPSNQADPGAVSISGNSTVHYLVKKIKGSHLLFFSSETGKRRCKENQGVTPLFFSGETGKRRCDPTRVTPERYVGGKFLPVNRGQIDSGDVVRSKRK